ncbi:SpvB/TcaC N-terminal domain-containing protein [Trinickia symbiotica]|uniref:SpvB/TcaC N-terminal domain-containing protein n=1 Tax=Trinickia symbiotica TaxID=863227 RepID=UPI00036C1D26|nr:SpvB/TcaC N-terminal domain-containing protein [Trinickia symbiotica]
MADENRLKPDSNEGADTRFRVEAPQLNLPKGGGAIRAIAEKFGLNPVTGTGSLSVPVYASPGRAGFGPQLSLTYDSGSGNGPFGFGWSLAINSISRKTDKGLPQYADDIESDIFILAGSEDLMPELVNAAGQWAREAVARTLYGKQYEVHRYHPRVEGTFARIERWVNTAEPQDTFWRSISKDNVTCWYGKTSESRIADPDDATRIFSWLICESYDDKGNVTSYRYKAEDSAAVDVTQSNERNRNDLTRSAKRYLKRIYYGNRTPYFPDMTQAAPIALPSDWCFEVVFDYGEHDLVNPLPQDAGQWTCRPDPWSTYRPSFEVRSYRLCRRVLMFHHFEHEASVGLNCLVRSTDFSYSTPPADPTQPVYSYLLSVTQTGYQRNDVGGYSTASLPPLEFEYSEAIIDETVFNADPDALENLSCGADGTTYRWVDLDGEGLHGILTEQGGSLYYKSNLSPAQRQENGGDQTTSPRFARAEVVARQPVATALRGGGQRLMDLSGDGQLDLVDFEPAMPGFFERTPDADWRAFKAFECLPNVNWNNPNLRFIDLTGDGLPDLLITEEHAFHWHTSLGATGFGREQSKSQSVDEEQGPNLIFADGTESIFVADMSGDGLTDLVRVRNGEVCYWPNLGYGRFGAKIVMEQSPRFDRPECFDGHRVQLADIDGSGTADIIYFANNRVDLYFNQSGNGYGARRSLRRFPAVERQSTASVVDLLGNGTACLVWSSPLPGSARRALRYIDLMGGQKPHLLVRLRNNMGAETVVRYAPSTRFYVADKLSGTPWVTRLPFPVHVVEQVQTYDYINRNLFVSRYAYHHGYFDGVEREFRGFGRVDQWDTAEFAVLSGASAFPQATNLDAASNVPPVYTKTWFHTGAFFGESRISKYLAHEYYSEAALTDAQRATMLLDDTILPATVLLPDGSRVAYDFSGEELREACRALRGSMLRQEVYGLDDTDEASRPYSVSERNYTIEALQPQGPNRYGVFFVHTRESLDFHYERKQYKAIGNTLTDPHAPAPARSVADPRVSHSMVFDVDAFGNVLRSASVGYGRRYLDPALSAADQLKQSGLLATYTDSTYTNSVRLDDAYRTPLPAQTLSYELIQVQPATSQPDVTALFRLDELRSAVEGAADGAHDIAFESLHPSGLNVGEAYRRLIACTRTYYRPDDMGAAEGDARALLPLGSLQSLALNGASYRLVFTPGLITQVYRRDGAALLPAPATVLASTTDDGGGYIDLDGDGRYWMPSGRSFLMTDAPTFPAEMNQARVGFFMPRRYEDPFGHATIIDYDTPHNLLTVRSTDPKGNAMAAQNDYRVLAPSLITDANANRAAAGFDALGLVIATAVMGKAGENLGDQLSGYSTQLTQPQLDALYDAADPSALASSLLGQATTRIVYDVNRFFRTRAAAPADPDQWLPAFSAVLARETHLSDLAPGAQSAIQISFGYSDGFGREIQKKVQAEPGPVVDGGPVVDPRWVGSGWTVFNNKGKPVRQYEPYFSQLAKGHQFEFNPIVGVSPIICYDAVERTVATIHPNHAYEKVVFDPWHQESWDVNDTVTQDDPTQDPDVGDFFKRLASTDYLPTWRTQRSGGGLGAEEQDAATKAVAHAATPALAYFDTLGRSFLTISNNAAVGKYLTHVELDIQGHQRAMTDPLGRLILTVDYDMLGRRLHQSSMEAGERWTLKDVANKAIRSWDSRGHNLRTRYDELRRPVAYAALGTDATNSDPRLLAGEIVYHTVEYGEGQADDQKLNLRTRTYRECDAAGIVSHVFTDPISGEPAAFDFKGNPLGNSRQFVQDYKSLPDWSKAAPTMLADIHVSTATYDALNRVTAARSPDGSVSRPTYNRANLLESIGVNLLGTGAATTFVGHIEYNAKGQRTAVEYGSHAAPSAITAYRYDSQTFRLASLTTTRPGLPAAQQPAQSLAYIYDPVGNITHITDAAQQTIYFNNQVVQPDCDYTYDAIYRLIVASGREQLGLNGGTPLPPTPSTYNDASRCHLIHAGDGKAMGSYSEHYQYDDAGNFLKLIHTGSQPANPGWTRNYVYEEASLLESAKFSNRLTRTTLSTVAGNESYSYDVHGNITSMPQLQAAQWDFLDCLMMTRRQAVNADDADGSAHQGERTYYTYNAAGERVRKVTESSIGVKTKERFYLGASEVYREYDGVGHTKLERQTLHVRDDKHRIALVETKTVDAGAAPGPLPSSAIRFQFTNLLNTACLELDENGSIVTYEEYYTYGGTSYQAGRSLAETSLKRYRYLGKERDEESGLNYFGARYYAPWLGRWLTPDPIGIRGGMNLYAYCHGNPISRHDPTGTQDSSTTAVGISIDTGGGVRVGPFSVGRDQNVVAFGRAGGPGYMNTAEANTGLNAINIQDRITLNRSLSLGRDIPPGLPYFPSGPSAERTFADPARPGGLSPMFSGVMAQEALEGRAAGTVHFDMRGVDLTPPLRSGTSPGFSLDDFHSSSEARQGVAHLASTGPGERNTTIVIQHEEGVTTIPTNSNTVQGDPLPARLADRMPNISNRPAPRSTPSSGSGSAGSAGRSGTAPRGGSSGSGSSSSRSSSAGAGMAFRSAASGTLGAMGRAIPGVVEGEAALMGAAYAAAGHAATRALVAPLMTASEALPVAAAAGVLGAGTGHVVRAGLEQAGVSHETASQVGFGAAVLTGAALGSFIPGVGTLVGAGIGALAAGALYLFSL